MRARLVDIRHMYQHHVDSGDLRVFYLNFEASAGQVLVLRISHPGADTDQYWELPLDDAAHVADVIRKRQALAQAEGL